MRAGLIVGGVLLGLIGFFLTITIIGAILGIPIGLLGFVMILVGIFSSGGSAKVIVHQHVEQNTQPKADDNLSILKNRLAKGEITKKQYNILKKELEEKD
jgi:uncharacterized membrane protein